jgi:succinate dehydrogenase assembly factor 2
MLRNLRISSHFLRISASLRTVSTTPFRPADPWILPNTPAHVSSTQTPPADSHFPDVQPLIRKNESLDRLISRLTYQSRKRGTLETDLLLSTFAKDQLLVMTEEELKEYDKVSVKPLDFFFVFSPFSNRAQLLDEPDWDIYYWSTGQRQPPERWAHSGILEKLRIHAKNEGKVVRRMPTLDGIDRAAK